MSDQSVTIVIKASNLTDAEFAKARVSVSGFAGDVKKSSTETQGLRGVLGGLGPLLATTFTVGAAVSFGKQLLDDADALVKLSDKTGIAIEPLQRLKYAAEQSGNTFEQVTSAVSMLQKRMAGGDDSTVGALSQLGLSFDAIKNATPDQQFKMIAAEVAKITDPMERVKVATDLFGRSGAEVLPTLIADVQKLGDAAPVMSAKATQAFDAVGDGISTVWSWSKTLVGEGIGGLIDGFGRLGEAANRLGQADLQGVADALLDLNTTLPAVQGAVGGVTVASTALAFSQKDVDAATKDLDAQLKAQQEQMKASEEAAKKFKTAIDEASGKTARDNAVEVTRVYRELVKLGLEPTTEFALKLAKANDVLGKSLSDLPLTPTSTGMQDLLNQMTPLAEETTPTLTSGMGDLKGVLMGLPPAISAVGGEMDKAAQSSIPFWEANKQAIGNVADAFEGLSRVAEMAGNKTIASVMSIASTTAKAFATGGPMGAAIAGIGALFTAFADKLFKLEGRKVNDLRDDFIAAAGGLHELNVKAHEAGLTLDRLLRAKNVKDYQAAVDELNAAFEQTKAKTEAAAQAAAAAAAKIKEEFDTNISDVNSLFGQLAEEAKKTGQGMPAQFKDIVEQMRQLGLLTDEAAAAIGDMGTDTTVDFAAMEEAAKKYGVDLASLGPKFQSAKLHDSAQTIWRDFQLLTNSGADVGGVLVGMQDEISQLVIDSRKFGGEIPAQFKPLIEELIRSGKLIGEDGKAITDMGGIKFGAPMVTEFDKIAGKLDELVTKITDGLAAAMKATMPADATAGVNDTLKQIDRIPKERRVRIRWDQDPLPDWDEERDPRGEDRAPLSGGLPGHARGGVFARPHRAWIAEGGQPEMIGSVAFMERALTGALRRTAGAGAGGLGGPPVVIHLQTNLDGRKLAENQVRHIPDVLARQGVR